MNYIRARLPFKKIYDPLLDTFCRIPNSFRRMFMIDIPMIMRISFIMLTAIIFRLLQAGVERILPFLKLMFLVAQDARSLHIISFAINVVCVLEGCRRLYNFVINSFICSLQPIRLYDPHSGLKCYVLSLMHHNY